MTSDSESKDTFLVYACGVDWQHDLRDAHDGARLFPTVEDLKANTDCWKQCGIVEIHATFVRWCEPQNFSIKTNRVKDPAA